MENTSFFHENDFLLKKSVNCIANKIKVTQATASSRSIYVFVMASMMGSCIKTGTSNYLFLLEVSEQKNIKEMNDNKIL